LELATAVSVEMCVASVAEMNDRAWTAVENKNATGEIDCRSLAMEAQKAQAEQQTETQTLITDQSARILKRATSEANTAAFLPSALLHLSLSRKSKTKDFAFGARCGRQRTMKSLVSSLNEQSRTEL
jgi:hypothetical protein